MTCRHLLALMCLAVPTAVPTALQAAESISVGYFLDWPTPNLVAKADGDYAGQLGVSVEWTAFETGTQMTEAFLAGQIDLAYSQGLAPFVTAVNAGVPIKVIAIAAQYPSNDCIVRDGSDVDRERPATLIGSTVALPVATMADYSFRMMLRALGVDATRLQVLDRIPNDAAVLLVDGAVDVACGFGALAMDKMNSTGVPLMTAAEKSSAGIVSFDVVSVDRDFARENGELISRFLQITHDANAAWSESLVQIDKVAAESGLDANGVLKQLADFTFPTVQEQRTTYFGSNGLLIEAMNVIGDAFASDDSPALEDYSGVIDPNYLR